MMALERMICTPLECCVHPRAYRNVPALSGLPVAANVFQTFSRFSSETPVTSEAFFRVYLE